MLACNYVVTGFTTLGIIRREHGHSRINEDGTQMVVDPELSCAERA